MRILHKKLRCLYIMCHVTALALIFLAVSLVILQKPAAKAVQRPDASIPNPIARNGISITHKLDQSKAITKSLNQNPVDPAFINAIPSSDGQEIEVFVSGVDGAQPIFLNVDSTFGPTSQRESYAMTISDTRHYAKAVGFRAKTDDNENAMSISTTVNGQMLSTDMLSFQKAHFLNSVMTETAFTEDGLFNISVPNANSFFSDEIYTVIMSTNTSPAELLCGYDLIGDTYQVTPSGQLSESQQPLILNFQYQSVLPNDKDVHTLVAVVWIPNEHKGYTLVEEGGNLLTDNGLLSFATKRFGVYGLATRPVWFDSFFDGMGFENDSTTQLTSSHIALNATYIFGTVTSSLITAPPEADRWKAVHFDSVKPFGTNLTVDLIDLNDRIVLDNVQNGAELSHLSASTYPSLKMRATLSSSQVGVSPELHEWGLGWSSDASCDQKVLYLPLVSK